MPYCSHLADGGSPYYMQVFNPKMRPGLCDGAYRVFTQEEFQEAPGLKRQCVWDRDDQIKEWGIVSIYGDETQGRINAAITRCRLAGR